jgi:hypothetical protein
MSLEPATKRALAIVLGATGIAIVAVMVVRSDVDALRRALAAAAGVAPFVLAIEGARLCTEARCTAVLVGHSVSWWTLARAQLAAYAVWVVAPAGRLSGELTKAAMLRAEVGGARALVVACEMQALALVANALVGVVCAAATLLGARAAPLGLAVLLQAVVAAAGAGIVLGALRGSRKLRRLAGRIGTISMALHHDLEGRPLVSGRALGLAVASRSLLMVELGLLLGAMGAPLRWWSAPVAEGCVAIGATLGDFIPAQLGAVDAALGLAAATLHTDASTMIGTALLFHAVQLAWAAIGSVVSIVPRLTPHVRVPITRRV